VDEGVLIFLEHLLPVLSMQIKLPARALLLTRERRAPNQKGHDGGGGASLATRHLQGGLLAEVALRFCKPTVIVRPRLIK